MAENKEDEKKEEGKKTEGQQDLQEARGKKEEQKKTTPDEGKTFDVDTVFVCVQDCQRKMRRYRPGDELTGRICPPFFIVKPKGTSKK